ncbi:MAG: metal ABC transporter permease [Okeania sp. SIO2G4]|uniref:metal ABC transporter permease n=1 Tax=unclassified Okeania TaxID=2634635 RepID=UPI0013BE703E|nr:MULTISPECIES: metal ABC transporter permease [unclassified Okeania]NEP04099.1 metal ABC transporter permease [Okeania sp. SIO4D6]NEP75454.1 metal ABC transporter permease [Okeania sp. SIO2G5]NEP96566.1 metal ABC transporter permease [Okeania sp. SIO2F5]NEQ94967.1 metal ABC transporter permease [Okeania sp. SIO2G4]
MGIGITCTPSKLINQKENFLNVLLEPLNFEFMRNALIMGILLGILCAVVGSYMIVQQMSMMGDMIAHSVMAGLPVAVFMRLPLSLGALVAGVVSAVVLSGIESKSRLKLDAVMALIFSLFLATGTTLVTVLPGANRIDVMHILFGDILGVTQDNLKQTFGITLIIVIGVWLFYKELLFYTFDPIGSQADGMRVRLYYLGMVTAISLTVVASMQTVGVLLVIAMLVAPGTTAYLLVKELHQMMILGSFLGAFASIAGMYLSYYLDIPSGSAIVLVAFGLFMLAFLFSPSQGILTQSKFVKDMTK